MTALSLTDGLKMSICIPVGDELPFKLLSSLFSGDAGELALVLGLVSILGFVLSCLAKFERSDRCRSNTFFLFIKFGCSINRESRNKILSFFSPVYLWPRQYLLSFPVLRSLTLGFVQRNPYFLSTFTHVSKDVELIAEATVCEIVP